jgi:UPF0042 nucleotide-binding protein
MKLILISGLSGAGKSEALKTLEDSNFYCIDNLPLGLLLSFVEKVSQGGLSPFTQFAVCIDARNQPSELEQFDHILKQLKSLTLQFEILFFSSGDSTLIKRFSETRRKHPLSSKDRPLANAIDYERQLLEPLLSNADLIVDTSHTSVSQLRELVRQRVVASIPDQLQILVQSFGFKNGVPVDSDFVFDVRTLPNPYWIPELRALSGLDEPVASFLEKSERVHEYARDITQFMDRWLPRFAQDQRHYLTLAIGCTGGQHRSVYLSERISAHLKQNWMNVAIRHRDMK